MKETADFVAQQDAHFENADRKHFAWQTRAPGLSEHESTFLESLLEDTHRPLLEIGCGEGANLFHLETQGISRGSALGIDRSVGKLAFAREMIPSATFICADGSALPYRRGSFATVLIRDVLHHLPDPSPTLTEACRVLRPGGTFVLAEPNAHNILIKLQMALIAAERGAARSDETWLRSLLARLPLEHLEITMAAALPLRRLILHPGFGLPSLGGNRIVRGTLDRLDTLAERLLSPQRWSYLVARARRQSGEPGATRADVPTSSR